MSQTPLHDWLRPRIDQLVRDATAAGFERDVVLVVINDLVSSTPFDTAPLPVEPELPLGPISRAVT
jgi:hypothetical protein